MKNKKYNLSWYLSIPSKIIYRLWKKPIPIGLFIINIIFQRIFRINSEMIFMTHFTSRVFGDIKIGENVWISFALSGNCYIQGGNGIIIDDNTIIAPGVKIISADHDMEDFKVWKKEKPILIGKKCWLGTNCVILPGVQLGNNVVVGAGSVVTKSFPDNSIIAGVPAKLIRYQD